MSPIKTALLSYGMSGKVFHAPFISLHPGFELAGAWERSKQLIAQDYPGVRFYADLESLLADDSIELVVVNTPTYSHYDYAKQALLAGKHIIVEKAFTTNVEEAVELKAIAEKQGKKIAVFQNRRWDSDFKTVQKIIKEVGLGSIVEAEFHFDRYNPVLSPKQHKEIKRPGAGLLMDLGPHLIDQAICLFGMPTAVFADIRITRERSEVDDWIDILLFYPSMRMRLKAGYFVRQPLPAFVVHGTKGSFIKPRADVQETNLVAGLKPNLTDWGTEPETAWGLLHVADEPDVVGYVTSLQGNYYDFYDGVHKALTNGEPMPVTVDDGINIMRIIAAASKSHEEKRIISL